MPSDLPRNVIKLLAALLKHQAELWLGEEAVGIAGATLVDIGGETLQQKIENFLKSAEGATQLLAAARHADRYFQQHCDDGALKQYFTLHFGNLPGVQKALADLPNAMDAGAVRAALLNALERDAPGLSSAQRAAGAALYTEALQRAMIQLKEYTLPVIAQTVLDIKKQLGEIGLDQTEIKEILGRIETKLVPMPNTQAPQPLRILAVIAAPVAGERDHLPAPASLSSRAEWAGLRRASDVAPMHLVRLRPPTETALRSLCSPNNAHRFNVVHFICHGLPGALALEDERGLTTLVNAERVAESIQDGHVQLVVVNACYSAAGNENSIAWALVKAGVRAVVAHRWPLIDPAAVLFSQCLYRELASGRPLQAAFTRAVEEATSAFNAEKGNAVLAGDENLTFSLPDGPVMPSMVDEGPALPDEATRFFGRKRQLLELADLFASDELRGTALTGIGGIGKSALAFEAGDRNAWRFPGGVAYVRAVEFGFTARDALLELARGLSLDAKDNLADALRLYVNTHPCLLIFDNMERAGSELFALAEFVASLNVDSGSKVLFTLRPPLSDRFKDIREINLRTGLDEADAIEYVRFAARNEGAPEQWQTAEEARALAQRVSGHPELIRLVIMRSKQIPFGRVKREYAALSGRLDEALQEMIGMQVNQGGKMAKKALAILTIFPQPSVTCEVAEAACGEAAPGLDALVEHGVLGLEHGEVQRYVLHPTALDWARSRKKDYEADFYPARQRSAIEYAKIAEVHANEFDLFGSEHDNFMTALEWAWENESWDEVGKLAQGMAAYLRMRGYWKQGHLWIERAVEARQKLPKTDENKKSLVAHLDSLARFYADEGNLIEALRLQKEANKLAEGLGDLQGKSATLANIGVVLYQRHEYKPALQAFLEALITLEKMGAIPDAQTVAGWITRLRKELGGEEFDRLWKEATNDSPLPDWLTESPSSNPLP